MPVATHDEVKHLNGVLVGINRQLTDIADNIASTIRWADTPFKQTLLDQLLGAQDQFNAIAESIRQQLNQLGV